MRLCAAPRRPHAPGCPDASCPSTACAGTPSTERGPRCPRGASTWAQGRMPLLGSPRTRVPSTAGSGAHSLRAPQWADPWSESPATGAQVRRGKEPGLGRAGGGSGSSRSQWKDRETISSEVCHVWEHSPACATAASPTSRSPKPRPRTWHTRALAHPTPRRGPSWPSEQPPARL